MNPQKPRDSFLSVADATGRPAASGVTCDLSIVLIHVEIAFTDVYIFCESLEILHDSLTAFIPRHNVIHFENYSRVCSGRTARNLAFKIVSSHDKEPKPMIDCS